MLERSISLAGLLIGFVWLSDLPKIIFEWFAGVFDAREEGDNGAIVSSMRGAGFYFLNPG